MKNNRTIKLDNNLIAKHKLSTAPPPPDSLFWKMWNVCTSIATKALNTNFIQGIKEGTLDPVTFGGFNVNDAYYCFNGAQDYFTAQSRTTHPTLKAFLLKKYNSYQNYNDTFPKVWHIKNAEAVVPNDVCKQYSDFESHVALYEAPIYTLIVMIPCEYLWAWLGAQLSPPSPGNLYASWINDNNYPDGAYAMGNFLDAYQKTHPVNETLAKKLYTQAMTYEYKNFQNAGNN